MTQARGCAFLAATLLATQAGAFVPGGLVHTPSVRVRAADPQKPASLHLLPMTLEDPQTAVPVPVQAPATALEVIGALMEDVGAAKRKCAESDVKTLEFLNATGLELWSMVGSLARKDSDHAFALAAGAGPGAAGGGAGAVQAVATVAVRVARDDFGKLPALAEKQGFASKTWAQRLLTTGSERVPVVDVTGLAARPGADPRQGAGGELIHEIASWAAASGRLVIVSEPQAALEAHFVGMGFERINAFDTALVYTGYGKDAPRAGQQFHLVTLEPEF